MTKVIDLGRVRGKDAMIALNLLDNSDFRQAYFIAQAGIDGYHGAEQFVGDRWLHLHGTGTVNGGKNGLILAGTDLYMTQVVAGDWSGKRLTFAVKIDGVIVCGAADAAQGVYADFAIDGGKGIHLLKGITDRFAIRLLDDAQHVIEWAALYEGEYTAGSLPPYVPKGYAAELAECMRYYYKSPKLLEIVANFSNSGKNWYFSLPVPTKMHCTPTTTIDRIQWVGGCGSEVSIANLPSYTYSYYTSDENTALIFLVFDTAPIAVSGSQTSYIALRYQLEAELY